MRVFAFVGIATTATIALVAAGANPILAVVVSTASSAAIVVLDKQI